MKRPSPKATALAAALRDLAGNALALEQATSEISQLTAEVVAVGKRLEATPPSRPETACG